MHARHIILSFGLVAGLLTSACTKPTQTTSNLGPRTQSGATIGAAVGGLIGATRKGDDRLAKTALGAVIGGVVGGAIGQELDRQAGDLRRSIGNDQVKIVNTGRELIVVMPNDILFATDSSRVGSVLRGDLAALAQNLRKYPNSVVEIGGHTDSVGTASYNAALSQRRANAVASILAANGVPNWRLRTVGYGENRPVASNQDAYGRQQNRRVEIVIRPTQG